MRQRFQFSLRALLAAIAVIAVGAAATSIVVRHIHEERLSAAREELRLAEAIGEGRLGMSSEWPPNWREIQGRARVARKRLDKLEGR
jgi:hypothetical protein